MSAEVKRDQERARLVEMNWDSIEEPGSYLMIDSGHLVTLPQEGMAPSRAPFVTIKSSSGMRVARLSDNPSESLPILRTIAAKYGYVVNF